MAIDPVVDAVLAMERAMWAASTRNDPIFMDTVLHHAFCEIGASGALHDRREAIAPVGILVADIELIDLRGELLGPTVMLVSYVTTAPDAAGHDRTAQRSSLWVFTENAWKLRFHQGTTVPAGPNAVRLA
jgi:hypothetical protein